MLLTTFIILLIATIILSLYYIIPFLFNGIHYENTKNEKIKTITQLCKNSKNITDLGSGSGKILINIAKQNPNSKLIGYEINPLLTLKSKLKSKKIKNLKFKLKNFWKQDLSKFDTIIIFQFKHIMPKLEKKLTKELKPNSIIISNHWKLPNLKPTKKINDIYIYKIHQT